MDVKDAILSRRTIFKFKPEPVPNDVIEQVFSFGNMGTQSPCHRTLAFHRDRQGDEVNSRRPLPQN